MVSLVVARTSKRKFDYKQQADGSTPVALASCAVERAMRLHCRGQISNNINTKSPLFQEGF